MASAGVDSSRSPLSMESPGQLSHFVAQKGPLMNTRIVYGDYQRPEVSILAGELTPGQIQRLAIAGWRSDLRPLADQLGLANVRGALYTERLIPTLEPATNARVNAQQFYAQVIPLFVQQMLATFGGADKNFAEGQKRITDFLRDKKDDELLSVKVLPWHLTGSNQDFVANWLRSMVGSYAMAVALVSSPEISLPKNLAEIGITAPTHQELGNDFGLILMPAVWPIVTGERVAPPTLLKASMPGSSITHGEVRTALAEAARFVTAATALLR